jgi:hypothetical protein
MLYGNIQDAFDSWKSSDDSSIVSNLSVLNRDIIVDTHDNAFSLELWSCIGGKYTVTYLVFRDIVDACLRSQHV